jgi:hypothetical protein
MGGAASVHCRCVSNAFANQIAILLDLKWMRRSRPHFHMPHCCVSRLLDPHPVHHMLIEELALDGLVFDGLALDGLSMPAPAPDGRPGACMLLNFPELADAT